MEREANKHALEVKNLEHKQAMESKKADLKADLTKAKMQDRKETSHRPVISQSTSPEIMAGFTGTA